MADPRFFKRQGPFSLQELAEKTGAELVNASSSQLEIEDVAPLDQANDNQLSFLDNIKYKDQFTATKAGACFVSPKMQELAPDNVALLVTPQPYKAYALSAQAFYPDQIVKEEISETAQIDKKAKIGKNCRIDHGAIIGAGVEIGDYCWVGANAVISHSLIGHHVRIYPGACIGQDGFGFAIDPSGHVKVPQLGRVIIEDGVQVGANTTIDRGAGPDTIIGAGTWIDNLVQIGHNVKIGRGCIIVAQVGISGSTVLEDFVALGGQAGIAGHLNIGMGARIAAQSGVMKNIPAGEEHMGSPSLPIKKFMKQVALLKKMIKK